MGRVVKFKHIKSIPLKFKHKVKLWNWPPPCLHVGMVTLEQLPALGLLVNINYTTHEQKTFVQTTALLIREEQPRNLHFLWHCHELGTEFGDVAKATTAPGQVATLLEPVGRLFNRPGKRKKERKKEWKKEKRKGRKKKKRMTGRANKAWSGMWGYVPTIVPQTSQERSQNPFHPLHVPFDLAVINFFHQLVYFKPALSTQNER